MTLTPDERLVWAAAYAVALHDRMRGSTSTSDASIAACVADANRAVNALRTAHLPTGVVVPVDISR